MINNNSNALSMIRKIIITIIPDSKIILFGSRARRDNNQESDYDLLVITRKVFALQEKRILKSLIRKELAKIKIPADVLIQSEDEINSKKEITGHILKKVLQDGIAL